MRQKCRWDSDTALIDGFGYPVGCAKQPKTDWETTWFDRVNVDLADRRGEFVADRGPKAACIPKSQLSNKIHIFLGIQAGCRAVNGSVAVVWSCFETVISNKDSWVPARVNPSRTLKPRSGAVLDAQRSRYFYSPQLRVVFKRSVRHCPSSFVGGLFLEATPPINQ